MSLETPNAFADEENILLHTALFKQVSPAEAEELLPHLKHATFDKGDYIFSEGDTDQRMSRFQHTGRYCLLHIQVHRNNLGRRNGNKRRDLNHRPDRHFKRSFKGTGHKRAHTLRHKRT